MTIRKFGTSDDQRAELDEQDRQGLSKSAIKRVEALTQEDRRELAEENETK